MMARPVALLRPPFPWPCFTKKLTVIGIIGQTHGMTSANRPPSAEAIRNGIRPCRAPNCAISLEAVDDEEPSVGAERG